MTDTCRLCRLGLFRRGYRRVSENTLNGIAELHASAVCPVS